MASVTSLDGDLRKLRLEKYTPAAAAEARAWIEGILGEPLAPGDLLEALKDGVALCRLANLAAPPPGIRFKKSAMPFVQMENISHFLRACQAPPLHLHQHDTFLTVDLYERKDPAQVIQCLGAFSRAAHKANPAAFPSVIGPRPAGNAPVPSPSRETSSATSNATSSAKSSAISPGTRPPTSIYSSRPPMPPARAGESVAGRWGASKERGPSPSRSAASASASASSTSSWSKRENESATSPAWNIAQYGYMGGASQGKLGISFGGRRQITSAGPTVPNATQKERMRKEKEAEELRAKQLIKEEEERRRRAELEAEEERARREEQRRWEEEAERQLAAEKRKVEEEKRKWEEEERQWQLTEEKRKREEAEAEARLEAERLQRLRGDKGASGAAASASAAGEPKLHGQMLSQYKAEVGAGATSGQSGAGADGSAYTNRVRELEKELELARQREQAYEQERNGGQARPQSRGTRSRSRGARSRSRPRAVPNLSNSPVRQDSWSRNDKEILTTPRSRSRHRFADTEPPLSDGATSPRLLSPTSPRPLPDPRNHLQQPQQPQLPPRQQQQPAPSSENMAVPTSPLRGQRTGDEPTKPSTQGRPLPDPSAYVSPPPKAAPLLPPRALQEVPPQPTYHQEQQQRQQQPQQRPRGPFWGGGAAPSSSSSSSSPLPAAKTSAPGKSLLEREMELERQRQREWEEAQKETASQPRQPGHVDGVDGRWDVNQWSGFTGGDGQNRGSQGIGAGRRQIVGPRPLPGLPGQQ